MSDNVGSHGQAFPPAQARTSIASRNRTEERLPARDSEQLLTLLVSEPPHWYEI
ncbi:hypothetical protein [Actinoplanes sp. NBRC 103695]|uniref:hypothetical protein n=1 Tax=Actinoplanes sp. NBRC 103695 TaxID=3032202 RepID=UPI0025541D1A|nr:hypothetical protein [Actinoplanes sp. NBRC 103695]